MQNAIFEVGVNTVNDTFNAKIIWKRTSPLDNGWKRGYAEISSSTSTKLYLMFMATLDADYKDNVGIDDVQILNKACPRTSDCDFELDTCGWINNGFDIDNEPNRMSDHTTLTNAGHYLITGSTSKTYQLSGDLEVLAQIGLSRAYCLKGWYKFDYNPNQGVADELSYFGLESSSYKAKNQNITLVSAVADKSVGHWSMFLFDIVVPGEFSQKTIITLSARTYGTTSILFDDFQIQLGQCQPAGDCDFESDFCGWWNSDTNLWIRSSVQSINTMPKTPSYVMNVLSSYGWFAVLPISSMKGTQAALVSPPLSKPFKCFSFLYFAGSLRTAGNFLRVSIADLTNDKVIFTQNINATSGNWILFTGNVDQAPKSYMVKIETLENITQLYTDLTIDDIRFSMECPHNYFAPEERPKQLSSKDLSWDCNFNSCKGWSYDQNWKMTSYKKTNDKSRAPRIDHTYKMSSRNYLLWTPKDGKVNETNPEAATLETTSNLTAFSIYCFSLWYYDTAEFPFELWVNYISNNHKIPLLTYRNTGVAQNWKQLKVPIYTDKGKFNKVF